jgi:hypothetical protein
LLDASRAERGRMARISQVAAMFDAEGHPALLFRNEPWCNGAVWSLNPNPWLGSPAPAESGAATPALQPPASSLTNAATAHWNDAIRERLYGARAKGRLDGEYLDSLEGYVTAELNYRREHFPFSTVPLTFDSSTHQPALFKGLAVFEFTKWIAAEVHALHKLTFANGVPYRFSFLCPWLDVMGTETDWLRNGRYAPASLSQMDYWRTMAFQKPYLLLLNTDYEAFTPDLVERYFQRSLFYGMFPSMFSHNAAENPYWRNPKWYNRDRPLFKKYIPWIKAVAEAGWQPVTFATSDNPDFLVERFGAAPGPLFFTIMNNTAGQQSSVLQVDRAALGLPASVQAREVLSGPTARDLPPEGWRLSLNPQGVALLELRSP